MNTHPILIKAFNSFGLTVSIDAKKAEVLTRAAEKIDHSGPFGWICPSHKGDEQLWALVDQFRDRFEPESITVINKWFKNHKGRLGDRSYRTQIPS